ncbi:unnamed protein product [Clonostachys chloroleuca]|uniref:Serine hydrolase domain-containing protein n=1 Tax=Clonostachys chloroleuca TaxID=1926264 RepID=A0AA35MHG8_9HYPO|nr:unnamed protein product [Clonostachys chloroleuca]
MVAILEDVALVNTDLSLPRILCLHGGGTNARIFSNQCRVIKHHLEKSFRLVFCDAPYISKPGPDVTTVYSEWGPFRSWVKAQPVDTNENNPFGTPYHRMHSVVMPAHENDALEVVDNIETSIMDAMRVDDLSGATGEWAGLLGFSQGAKIAASVLLREQERAKSLGGLHFGSFRFAILLAGQGPLVSLDHHTQAYFGREEEVKEALLELPTVHVHGLRDAGLRLHQEMRKRCCSTTSTVVVEWDGDHRVPIKTAHVNAVVTAVMKAYQRSKLYVTSDPDHEWRVMDGL